MNITCVGGGPGGLMAAILLKLDRASRQVAVYEQKSVDEAPGWGIVLPDQALDIVQGNDPILLDRLQSCLRRWDRIDIYFREETISCGGHALSAISRRRLLQLLSARAREIGVDLHYGKSAAPAEIGVSPAAKVDLIIAADGASSRFRSDAVDRFEPVTQSSANRFLWLGTDRGADAFSFVFVETEWGWFQAHTYPYDDHFSTFIVETTEVAWRAAGLTEMDGEATSRFCERLFHGWLGQARLISLQERPHWRSFVPLSNGKLVARSRTGVPMLLLGDAAHCVHFSIGSGTRLAFEDALDLRDALRELSLDDALAEYEQRRLTAAAKLQSAARNSTQWFETVARHSRFPAAQFGYSLLTRSQRVGHAELAKRDASYVKTHQHWLQRHLTNAASAETPPMFLPLQLRSMRLSNRVVVSPMAMYSAIEGIVGDFHLVHLGARALGGAGLIVTEMTAISAEGRITPGCAGLYTPDHIAAWRRIVDFIHRNSDTKICLQLGHAGPKGATKRGWDGMDEPLSSGEAWPLIAPSAIPWGPAHQMPEAMESGRMRMVRDAFVSATHAAAEIGFDMIELHAAHGYLLSSFLTPLTNRRDDSYGGSVKARLRYPIDVFSAMRAVWPEDRPFSVRISAHDWVDGGVSPQDAVAIAQAFKAAGADLIDVSAGQTSAAAKPIYGRMFQTPFSDLIRNEVGIATMAVGNITEPDQINTIIAAGRADLCALARPHLSDPNFTLRAAAAAGMSEWAWPKPYQAGGDQLIRLLQNAAAG